MAYFSTLASSRHRTLTAKNRVWEFFSLSSRMRPANHRQSLQPRRKTRPTTTNPASGIPRWPSRDPIGEKGGTNLYSFVGNYSIANWDMLGLSGSNDDDDKTEGSNGESIHISSDPTNAIPILIIGTIGKDTDVSMTSGVKTALEQGTQQALNKNADVILAEFNADVKIFAETLLRSKVKKVMNECKSHIRFMAIGHSYGGHVAVFNNDWANGVIKDEQAKHHSKRDLLIILDLITIDAIEIPTKGTALTKGPSVKPTYFTNYYTNNGADWGVHGAPITGATNIEDPARHTQIDDDVAWRVGRKVASAIDFAAAMNY